MADRKWEMIRALPFTGRLSIISLALLPNDYARATQNRVAYHSED